MNRKNHPVRAWFLLALVVGVVWGTPACGDSSTGSPPPAEEVPAVPEAPTVPEQPTPAVADGRFHTDDELSAVGLNIEPRDHVRGPETVAPGGPPPTTGDYDFVCGADTGRCVCRLPLPCTERGDCITLDDNLAGFRSALEGDGDRTVHCEWAETGRCGDFRYFYFQGGIHRYEMRWFDEDGRLVAQRNWTDYPEYCNHTALTRWQGRVPKCETLERTELICGEGDRPLRTPLEDLRGYAGIASPPPEPEE